MKKKMIANMVMVAVIVLIAAAGILTVGHFQGWFDKADEDRALLTDIRGVVNLERDGVIFPVEEDTVLRAGDCLRCENGGTAVIRLGSDYLAIGEKAALEITEPASAGFAADVTGGEVFANTQGSVVLSFDGREVVFSNAVAALSVRTGTQSIDVYAGTVAEAGAGQIVTYLADETSVQEIQISSLNDFLMDQIRAANATRTLCFSNADLDQLLAERNQALQELLDSQTKPAEPDENDEPNVAETVPDETADVPEPTDSDTKPTEPADTKPTEPKPTEDETVPSEPDGTEPEETEPETQPTETTPKPTEPEDDDPTEPVQTELQPTEPPETKPEETELATKTYSCTLTIRCDTILSNWDNLNPSKAEFVPSSGVILSAMTVEFEEGETAFDVLVRVCDTLGIQIEYSWTPLYGSYYIEGINNLYQKDCGPDSGWMYKVNGWFPNYGCSSYELSDGDVIEFLYSCVGYGTDVGAPGW